MAAYKEQYYNLPEEEVQKLITESQLDLFVKATIKLVHGKHVPKSVFYDKSNRAQAELLKTFHNFLTKYVTMLYYGKYNLNDYDIRRFTALFVKDINIRRFLLKNKLNDQGFKHVQECMRGITMMTQRYGDEEDIRQTVSMTFLQCVSRYRPAYSKIKDKEEEVVPFKGYIYSYFFYLLKRNVDAFLIDQLGRRTFPLLSDEEVGGEDDSDVKVQGFTAPPEPGVEETLGPDEVDEFWVAGDSAMWPFTALNQQERQILKWKYVDGFRSSEIAQKITEHPNTVREHFKRIRAKMQEIVGDTELY